MLKVSDLKELDLSALNAKVSELRKELFTLNLQRHTTGLEKSHEVKIAKKNIARVLTVINSKSGK